jgi:hypothetical protein
MRADLPVKLIYLRGQFSMSAEYRSIHKISEASIDELAPFVGRKTATEIADHFARQRALAEGASAA